MDIFFGNNQIHIVHADQYRITFTTPWGTFTYWVMPFGVKKFGATFQRAMEYTFHDLTHIILSYLNNRTGQSKKRLELLEHLQLVFQRYRQYNIQLNPIKCFFHVTT